MLSLFDRPIFSKKKSNIGLDSEMIGHILNLVAIIVSFVKYL